MGTFSRFRFDDPCGPAAKASEPDSAAGRRDIKDQNAAPGIEDPVSVITFNNTSGVQLNVAQRVGVGDAEIGLAPNQTASSLTIRGSNTFTFHVEGAGHNAIVTAVARQQGQRTAAAICAVYGVALDILP